ncbi:MAG: hypothetical protein F6K54_24350 [Okeania sp. SIO3B5]|uniref:hypothetical protein n=1 Tax=Okeania sp. SIO3B5 TaxID=2607811 RepID=UPI0014019A3D|nr:hypothetical protein [Okeania sp. SIO3B5]NEO55922.1 hypothetical protein [Okeania sp. SIO3B5]
MKQRIQYNHKCDDDSLLSSEVEFSYEVGRVPAFEIDVAKINIAQAISAGRPDIYKKALFHMGVQYSIPELREKTQRFQKLCGQIDRLKFKITQKEEALKFLFGAEDKLDTLIEKMKTTGIFPEFCNFLEAFTMIKGSEDLKEEKEQLSHLKLPMVFPSEGEAEDKSDQKETDTN